MVFGASFANAQAISSHFANLVQGTVGWSPHYGAFEYSSDGVQSIWQSRHNLPSWIQIVAESLTAAIRSNGTIANPSDSNTKYAGVAKSKQAFVHVRWVWIVYPSAMLVVGTLHLMVTIWQTVKGNIFAWKTSPLVPLLLSVEDEHSLLEDMGPSGHVPNEVQDRKVLLRFEDRKSWRFVSLNSVMRDDQ